MRTSNVARIFHIGWQLPLTEKLIVIFLFFYGGIVRLCLLILPFKLLSRALGQNCKDLDLTIPVSQEQEHKARRLATLVKRVSANTPWQSKCLVQAIMTRSLLSCYEIPTVLHLGAKLHHRDSTSIKAHAWVKVGTKVIIGGGGHRAFGIVSTFAPAILSNNRCSE